MVVALWPLKPNRWRMLRPAPSAPTTPYLDLMRRAIVELRISARQPKKEIVVAWFREQTIDRQPLSENFARHLATFVRLPESQRGDNRKWRFDEEDCSARVGT